MTIYKEKQFLVFDFEDGQTVKYDFATKTCIGKRGKPVSNLCSQLRGLTIDELCDCCVDEQYGKFLRFVKRYGGEYGEVYHDLPRDNYGNINHDEVELYIACQYGNKITEYGKDISNRMVLKAYIPSIGRGRNIKKAMDAKNIPYTDYFETDEEVEFHFKAKDIAPIAELMKVKTGGANVSPFSNRNLPRADVEIPTEEIERYKAVTAEVQKDDLLVIHRITNDFLSNFIEKRYRKIEGKSFDVNTDMKKMKMKRMVKEYIWTKGFWEEYLNFLHKKIKEFYKNKNNN